MPIYSDQDPIVAIATASGRGGVGIVRLSGNDAFITGFIKQFFGPDDRLKPRYAHYRQFKESSGSLIDEGLAIYFPAPRSYTGESVLELQAHGGPVVMRMLLEAVLQMDMLGHNFFIYEDAETQGINIVYRRKDGRYGLIEAGDED